MRACAIVVIKAIEPILNERFDCFWELQQLHLNIFDMALFGGVDAAWILSDRPGNEIPEFSFRIFFAEYVPADYFV